MFIDERQPWGYYAQRILWFRILRRRKGEPIRQRKKKMLILTSLKEK